MYVNVRSSLFPLSLSLSIRVCLFVVSFIHSFNSQRMQKSSSDARLVERVSIAYDSVGFLSFSLFLPLTDFHQVVLPYAWVKINISDRVYVCVCVCEHMWMWLCMCMYVYVCVLEKLLQAMRNMYIACTYLLRLLSILIVRPYARSTREKLHGWCSPRLVSLIASQSAPTRRSVFVFEFSSHVAALKNP